MIYLKYNTASQEIPLGYFLDSTDGNTEETGLTINNTDIHIWKNGAMALSNKNSGGATHISNGIYYAVLDATDTNTLGSMVIFVHVSGALTVKVDCCVLPANIYDSWISGTDYQDVNTVEVEGSDATDQIRDSVVNDATKIDGSALNTLSSHDPGEVIMGATDLATEMAHLDADISSRGTADPGDQMNLADDAITSAKYDESTAYPIKHDDSGNTEIARTGADSDTLETLSDEIATLSIPTVNQITAGILAMTVEGTLSFANVQRLLLSALAGKTTGNGLNFRDVADAKDRITVTVDTNHNRTSVVLDGD